jgi:NAD+ synthase
MKQAVENIRKELKEYITKNGIKSLVMGISGGIDSALCAALAKPVCDELNIPLIGRSIPIATNKVDEISRAKAVGEAFCTDFEEKDLTEEYEILSSKFNFSYMKAATPELERKAKIRNGNIKARLRMIYLYNLASLNDGMVLSTDNWTEFLLGFWTLHGDVGDYGMIQELWKTEVYEMAQWLYENELGFIDQQTALKSCVDCQATDGLGITNTDLDQLIPGWTGTSRDGYKEVDKVLHRWATPLFPLTKSFQLSAEDIEAKIENHPVVQRHIKSSYKRNNPTNISRSYIFSKTNPN